MFTHVHTVRYFVALMLISIAHAEIDPNVIGWIDAQVVIEQKRLEIMDKVRDEIERHAFPQSRQWHAIGWYKSHLEGDRAVHRSRLEELSHLKERLLANQKIDDPDMPALNPNATPCRLGHCLEILGRQNVSLLNKYRISPLGLA